MSRKQKKVLYRIIAAFAITILGVWLPIGDAAKGAVMFLAYGIIGYDILISALRGLIYGRVLDENLLMSVATIGAIAIAIYEKSGNFTEAVAVMLLYQTGELFQSCAVGKSRKNITALMDIRPDYANLETDGKIERVSPELVKAGSIIVVRPGEKIPIDAIVIEGDSCIDTSALTGESMPREVKCGSEVLGGCINMTGVLKIRTTKEFKESTVAKILELVEKSGLHKAKSEKFISKFARIYTPVVFTGAVILAAMPPIINIIVGRDADFAQWIYRALTFLVISCPCALVISIPLSFFAGMGGVGKAGVLIKGANFIEALAKTETVVFDKTGTLTKGSFEVLGMHHNTMNKEDLIEYAALAESASSHPIGKRLQAACKCELDLGRVTEINEIGGNGVVARIDGKRVAIGNNKLMESLRVDYITCHSDGTICHIAIDGEYQGHIVVADAIKETAAPAIAELKKIGIKKIVMLTGDLQKNAEAVGKKISIADIRGGLLPTDKVSEVEKLLEKKSKKGKLLFIGDGVNDAPVLKRADIGVAMGALGSDAAIEAADVVLMDDNPRKIATAIRIARRCVGIVYQNIIFALGIKLLCLALGAVGIADMWLAIFADVGVMVIAVLNALRALYYRKD